MKTISLRTFALSAVLIGSLTACKDKAATDEAAAPAPTASTQAPAAPAPMEGSESADAPTAIPDTADGIWTAIDAHSAELKATIDSGNLSEVHHHAFAIRDLVAALPAHSPTLAAEDQTKLQGEVKFVTTLADRLDQTGDANDKAGTQANYDQLVSVLTGITRTK
ncbi:hypothetical protein BH11PSE14_BH11PSE14_14010 [soil metagenome]